MFDSCNITPLLLTFARCPHFESALLSRIVLSFLTPLLNYEQLPALKLDKVETAYFASTLQQAMHSSDQEAEGYSILELLKIITCFTNSCYGLPLSFKDCKHRTKSHNQAEVTTETCGMSNKVSRHQCELMKYSKMIEENISLLLEADILSILEQLIQVADEESRTAVAIVLWNLLHYTPVKQHILMEHSSIVSSLHALLKSSQSSTQQAVLCALILLGSIEEGGGGFCLPKMCNNAPV